jgi:hypothetical protein
MTNRKKLALPLALVVTALGALVVASVAQATHPRPKSATPTRVSLVPAFNQCTAGTANRTHGPPLVFPSCNPPVQSSGSLTVGTPDANGAAANSVASIKIRVVAGDPATPADEADVELIAASSDVRCKAGVAACGAANAADGADYTGEVQGNAQIRITDHWNAVAPGGGPDAATVVDIPFPVTTPCTGTASTAIGSNCNITTTADTVVPGAVKELKRAIVELGQIHVNDGGVDGVVGTDPNTLFAVQGIFIP